MIQQTEFEMHSKKKKTWSLKNSQWHRNDVIELCFSN